MAKKNIRNRKVCGQSGYKYETVPAIILKGKWLEELGFHLGDYVQVKSENSQLIITPDVNKAQEQEAKTAFMDEEIKKLKIRYQNEKEEITAKYVAEQSAGCYGKKTEVDRMAFFQYLVFDGRIFCFRILMRWSWRMWQWIPAVRQRQGRYRGMWCGMELCGFRCRFLLRQGGL